MSEAPYQPKPYKDRPSQNIKVNGYLKYVGIVLLPLIGNAIGYLVGKQIPSKPQASPLAALDGDTLSIFEKYQNFLTSFLGPSPHKGKIFGVWGAKIGVAVSAFLLWQQKEKKHLEVGDTVQSVKEIAHLHQTNEDLELDNKVVKKMIEHQREKQGIVTKEPTPFSERMTSSAEENSTVIQR